MDFNREVYCLLGLPFDAADAADVTNNIRKSARERRRFLLSTPNVNWLVGCRADERFRDSVIASDLSAADGMPLVWIARLLGIPIRHRIAGSTVFEALHNATAEPLSVFFFGGPDGVAATACERLNASGSALRCAGFEFPGFGSIEQMSGDRTIAKINASRADFLVVSLGAQKGQAWIIRNQSRLAVPVLSHLGAVANFIAGTVRRAPPWMQRTGLEWIWRIKEEPVLWRRYLGDGMALLGLLLTRALPYALYLQRNKPDAAQLARATAAIEDDGQNLVLRLAGAWTRANVAPLRECFSRSATAGRDLRLELNDVTYVDSAVVALLMMLRASQAAAGRQLSLVSPQVHVRRVIRYCCAEYLLATAGHNTP
jgi:N-acetylglucosaminyldiphosphoundecaprenol N-acetyl-beta-D-mannosaminyltransferase